MALNPLCPHHFEKSVKPEAFLINELTPYSKAEILKVK